MVSATSTGFASTSRIPPPRSSQFASGPGPIRNVRTMNQKHKKRTGYGLFFSDEEDEDEPDESPAPQPLTSFSTRAPEKQSQLQQPKVQINKSSLKANFTINPEKPTGLVNGTLSRNSRDDFGIQTTSSSRLPHSQNARLNASTGPSSSRNSRLPTRRQPYSKAGPTAAQKRQRETELFDKDNLERQSIQSTSPRYTMRGAVSAQTAQQTIEPLTPDREAILPKTPETKSKTWGQWLKEFIPESVRKATSLKASTPNNTQKLSSPDTQPEANDAMEVDQGEENMDKSYKYPGSFDEGLDQTEDNWKPQATIQERFTNALRATENHNKTPIRSPMRRDLNSPFFGSARLRSKYSAGLRAVAASRSANVAKEESSLLSQSFVARSPRRRSPRSHPYSRSTTPPHLAPESTQMKPSDLGEETGNISLEERLEELEKREKDRRVQAQEDRYTRRILEAKLGRIISEDVEDDKIQESSQKTTADEDVEKAEATEEISVEATEWKSTGKLEELEKEKQKDVEAKSLEAGEPKDSARTPSPPPPYTSFLFSGALAVSPPPTTSPPTPSPSPPAAPIEPTAAASDTQMDTTALSFSSDKSNDSDKENASASRTPPPAPIPAHAQLPPPSPIQPPLAVSPSPKKHGLFGTNLSDAASKARSQAEKFKPHAPSGLRASTTIQAESPPRKPTTSNTGLFTPPQASKDQPIDIYASPPAETEVAGKSIFATPAPSSNLFTSKILTDKPALEPPSTQKQPLFVSSFSASNASQPSSEVIDVKTHIALLPSNQFQTITFPAIHPIGLGTAERDAIEKTWTVPTKDEAGDILKALMAGFRPLPHSSSN